MDMKQEPPKQQKRRLWTYHSQLSTGYLVTCFSWGSVPLRTDEKRERERERETPVRCRVKHTQTHRKRYEPEDAEEEDEDNGDEARDARAHGGRAEVAHAPGGEGRAHDDGDPVAPLARVPEEQPHAGEDHAVPEVEDQVRGETPDARPHLRARERERESEREREVGRCIVRHVCLSAASSSGWDGGLTTEMPELASRRMTANWPANNGTAARLDALALKSTSHQDRQKRVVGRSPGAALSHDGQRPWPSPTFRWPHS